MNIWIRGGITGALALTAVFTASRAVSSISSRAAPAPVYSYEWSVSEADAEFFLRDYNGHIGVFAPSSGHTPVTVTDIEVRNLRKADRAMLTAGIAVSDREELLTLLEDFGS